MFKLFEDNKSIYNLVQYLETKVITLRKNKKIDADILRALHEMYIDVINPWMQEYYLINVEPNARMEEQIQNSLLELITYIDIL